jgi:hypothetical protein
MGRGEVGDRPRGARYVRRLSRVHARYYLADRSANVGSYGHAAT